MTRQALLNLVDHCAALRPGERVLVLADPGAAPLGQALAEIAAERTALVSLAVIEPLRTHGAEPPAETAARMAASDVIFCLTAMSLAHTRARAEAAAGGTSFFSLPDYSRRLLERPALRADFRALTPLADALAARLTAAREILVLGEGTELRADLTGRRANSCPGWRRGPGSLASPPDAETNIAPLEKGSRGVIAVNGSVPHPRLGVLGRPLVLEIQDGRITDGPGEFLDLLGPAPESRVLAEIGFGLNPLAELCGIMLEDEGCLGTIHFGFGSNWTIGGANRAPLHIDAVTRQPTVLLDGEPIMDRGVFTIKAETDS